MSELERQSVRKGPEAQHAAPTHGGSCMTEHRRICKRCGKPFTTTHPNRLYCLECRPPRAKHSRTHRLTRQERLWCEARSFENLCFFYQDSLEYVDRHGTTPEGVAKAWVKQLRDRGIITYDYKEQRHFLTERAIRVLKELKEIGDK